MRRVLQEDFSARISEEWARSDGQELEDEAQVSEESRHTDQKEDREDQSHEQRRRE
jgi:hypothetical protein